MALEPEVIKTRHRQLYMLLGAFLLAGIFMGGGLAFKIRLYHRDLYMGLPETEGIVLSMVNYEIAQKFESEALGNHSCACILRAKDTSNYVLDIAADRNFTLIFWGRHDHINQQFIIGHYRLNARRLICQDRCVEYLPKEDELRLQICSENENQMFLFVEDEDEDHGMATQMNVTLRQDVQGNFVYGIQAEGDHHSYMGHRLHASYHHHGLGSWLPKHEQTCHNRPNHHHI